MEVPQIELNSGWKIPVIGMGTATYPVPPEETVVTSVLDAISIGYRHFDTASLYQSERPLGQAIATALHRRLISSRDEIFVTTKLWCTDADRHRVVPALQTSLRNLGLSYVDLFLIHYPVGLKGEKDLIVRSELVCPMDMKSVWEGMEECQSLGLTRSIGVSNFTCKKLAQLLKCATVIPAVNQVEMHVLFQQKQLRDLCSENGIHVTAYCPLGGKGVFWGTNLVLDCEEIEKIAQSIGKTKAQVCIRWLIEQGVSTVPKSFNKERLKENFEVFNWHLDEKHRDIISKLPQKRLILAEAFVPSDIYKTHSEFWDDEM